MSGSELALDATFTEHETPAAGSALALRGDAALADLAPLDREAVQRAHDDFEWLKAKFLDRRKHIDQVNGKDFVKGAGWEHLGMCLSISLELVGGRVARELIEDHRGNRVLLFTAVIRATRGGRSVDREGSCGSDESKHSQSIHKMASVAQTRAVSRAIAALVGGADAIAEDARERVEQQEREERAQQPKAIPVSQLLALHEQAGSPGGTFREWLPTAVPTWAGGKTPLKVSETIRAAEALQALIDAAAPPTSSRENAGGPSEAQRGLYFSLISELRISVDERHAFNKRATGKSSTTEFTADDMRRAIDALQRDLDARNAASA